MIFLLVLVPLSLFVAREIDDLPSPCVFCCTSVFRVFFPLPAKEAPGRRDARRVLECLQRSLKIADVCIAGGVNAQLFIEILNHYVYFFEADNPEVRCGAVRHSLCVC